MPDCIFCKILKQEVPAKVVWEDTRFVALLDAFPAVKGQVLVIPKDHVEYLFDLDTQFYTELWTAVREVADIMQRSLEPTRVCIRVEGFEVPHVHVKLYPTDSEKNLSQPTYQASEDELNEVFNKIKAVV